MAAKVSLTAEDEAQLKAAATAIADATGTAWEKHFDDLVAKMTTVQPKSESESHADAPSAPESSGKQYRPRGRSSTVRKGAKGAVGGIGRPRESHPDVTSGEDSGFCKVSMSADSDGGFSKVSMTVESSCDDGYHKVPLLGCASIQEVSVEERDDEEMPSQSGETAPVAVGREIAENSGNRGSWFASVDFRTC